jgi:hypothetical protein
MRRSCVGAAGRIRFEKVERESQLPLPHVSILRKVLFVHSTSPRCAVATKGTSSAAYRRAAGTEPQSPIEAAGLGLHGS